MNRIEATATLLVSTGLPPKTRASSSYVFLRRPQPYRWSSTTCGATTATSSCRGSQRRKKRSPASPTTREAQLVQPRTTLLRKRPVHAPKRGQTGQGQRQGRHAHHSRVRVQPRKAHSFSCVRGSTPTSTWMTGTGSSR